MRALVVTPGRRDSAHIADVPEPVVNAGDLLVEALAVGVCGTDREIIDGAYGIPPAGDEYLILGHESLGRVLHASPESGFVPGEHVVGIVRRPDPVPCANCAAGEWDMCRNGKYTERGIKQRHGYCSERFSLEAAFAVRIDPSLGLAGVLVEPASVVAKAWEHVERIGGRTRWTPRSVLVTGAGPVGLLAALMGQQRGLEIHVLDRVNEGPKPELVRQLGATYHSGVAVTDIRPAPDIVLECTGVAKLIFDAIQCTAPNGIVCLTGLSSGGTEIDVDFTSLNRTLVLENDVVFGTVNANRRHYELAAHALSLADPAWLAGVLTRKVALEQWQEAVSIPPTEVKAVITLNM